MKLSLCIVFVSISILLYQGDPVKDLVYRYMGEQEALKRQILTSDRVTQDTDGLKQLMVKAEISSVY